MHTSYSLHISSSCAVFKDDASTTLIITGTVSPPSTPRTTSISPLSTSLLINWEDSGDTVTVDKFRIEATYIGPCTSEAGGKVTTEVDGNIFQHNLTNLRAYSTYKVMVIAINNAGETSGQERQVVTLPAGKL